MKRRPPVLMGLAVCFWLGVSGAAVAQWSSDPLLNLAVADPAGDQIQAKVIARPGGGYYVSWFDNRTGGYDVYLQLLDEAGVEQWAHNGVLVADRSFSSTQDYGLGVDTAGDALLAFRDDRFTGEQITAAKVDASGTLVWGANGVQLTSTTAFVAAPKIVGTTDGQSVVAWKNDADVHLQRLDTSGATVWAGVSKISDALSRDYSLSDLQSSDSGSVIASAVFQPSGFLGPKHLHVQKFSSLGVNQWGATPVVVFDGGSLQFGNFPDFVSDGAGGGAFSWYDTSSGLKCFAQHVDASGTESFPHNGAGVTGTTREQASPDVAYDPVGASTYVFWSERLPGPTPQYAMYAQRFDAAGAKQWGANGIEVEALSPTEVGTARVTLDGSDAMTFWQRSVSVITHTIVASKLDANGTAVWAPAQLDVATTVSGKSRLFAEMGPDFAVLSWSDDRAGQDDVYVQNVNPDGTLGPPAAGPGEVAGLVVGKGPGSSNLTLSWGPSCSIGADYGVFVGTLSSLQAGVYNHGPLACTDAIPLLEETLALPVNNTYYLVVPLDASAEGSHGVRRNGGTTSERPVGAGQCVATQKLGCP